MGSRKPKRRPQAFDEVLMGEAFEEWQKTGQVPTWMANESPPWRERKTVDDLELIVKGVRDEDLPAEPEESQDRIARLKKKRRKKKKGASRGRKEEG